MYQWWKDLFLTVIGLVTFNNVVLASRGDRSFVFRDCYTHCEYLECAMSDSAWSSEQPFFMRILQWDCTANCDYKCMWNTVDAFQMDGAPVPQFYGKWPFIRVLGVQEPASVIFSILNAIPHIFMIMRFRKKVASAAPMYNVWHFYAGVNINAWFWSTVFHARDTPFTEQLDYYSALLLVMVNIFALAVRVFGIRDPARPLVIGFLLVVFFAYHINYLMNVKFDYGYNMKVNIAVGLFSSVGWLYWCYINRKERPYVWKAAASISAVNILMLLEVFDFPPLWWTFDAHSLWHAGTSPLGFLWYSFVIDDSLQLLAHPEEKFKEIFLDSTDNETEKDNTESNSEKDMKDSEAKKDL